MPAASPLREALKKIVQEVVDENANQNAGNLQPSYGVVININNDGSVDVQTDSQTFFSVGYPDPNVVIGTQVIVVTGDGIQTAIPK